MLRMLILSVLLGVVLVAASVPAHADDEASLRIGDAAPAIDVTHWIKGVEMDGRGDFEPVTTFAPGQVYVLEFWATWCGPCRRGMPHLSQLQEAYADRGVTIIGISDESLPKVVQFLWQEDPDGQIQNDRTRYVLAADPDRSVFDAYMGATGQRGIPTSFVVGKDGKLEWIGHPSELDEVLEAIVEDTWDRAAFAEAFERERRVVAAMEKARGEMMGAMAREDWEAVVRIFDDLLVVAPDDASLQMQKLNVLLTRMDDRDRALGYAKDVAQTNWENAGFLNMVAWTMLDDENVRHRDPEMALILALRASELEANEDPAILDTVARAHYEKGDLEKALAWQEKAVAQAPEGQLREQLEEVLAKYRTEKGDAAEAEPTPPEAETSTPVGRTWALRTLLGAAAVGERTPALEFLADGRLAVFGGVNRLVGAWKREDGKLSIGPVAGTRMAGPEPLMRQEQALAEVLGRIDAWRVEGKTLTLLEGTQVLATLEEGD